MALAFYIAFIPHQSYPYPLHIDEWVHMAHAEAILKAGSTTYLDPFSGAFAEGLSTNLEAGFQIFWGIFHQISGISWLTIFRYFPGIILIITVLSAYILAQRQGFGWEAALFTCLIPTTIGILGPSFLVPVAMGLLFIPLSLFLAFNFRSGWSYLAIFIFTCFLLAIHAPSAICLVIILIPYILLNLKGDFKHSLGMGLALLIPFLAPFPWIFSKLLPTAKSLLASQAPLEYVALPRVIESYGSLPITLCILGAFLLAIRSGKKNYGLVLGLLALLAMLVAFFTLHYGIHIMYERGLVFMMLMLGIIAGAGLMEVKNFSLPEKLAAPLKSPAIAQHVGKFLCLVLIGVTLFIAIPERQNTRYYHMIDTEDYQAFIWIKENVGKEYEKAILDPWKATPFAALTGKRVYSRIHAFPTEKDRQASLFLKGGCSDTAFLREKGISIIYTEEECRNPDLTEVRDNVFILKTAQDSTERKNRLSSLNIRYLNPAPRLFPDLASYIPFIALKTILC